MTPFEQYFDGNLFVINLKRRPDRRAHFEAEMAQIGVTLVERFEAIDAGADWGNNGCNASHKAVLGIIIERNVRRAFIFEDDATVRDDYRDNFQDVFASIIPEIPLDFQMCYLGGHYAEAPRARISPHVILMGEMKTTSSYGVTLESARELHALIPDNCGQGIDSIYAEYNRTRRCYITQPRFFVQYNNYSDLQKGVRNWTPCMEDWRHEATV